MEKTPDDLGAFIKKGCNIGLVCGKASGVDALDLDIDFFTSELLDGCAVETLVSGHRDGRGHLLFQHDDSLFSEKHHFIGIEYFGNNKEGAGSNLVLPPSIHVSGEVYKWKNPDILPAEIPDKLKENMLVLFKKEDKLHEYFNKCRHCFTKGSKKYPKEDPRSKGLWDRPDNITVHGMDGRRAVIAIMGELRNVGCPDELMHMACKRFFGKDYKFDETAENLKHIKPIPPKCETLRQVLNIECEGCAWVPKAIPKEEVALGEKICATCLFRPSGGVGGCKNPENKTVEGKQKRNKYTTDEMPACEKYREKPKKIKEKKEKTVSVTPESSDPRYTDMRNSRRLAAKIQDKAKYNPSSKKWLIYNGKIWEEDKKGLMLRFAREVVRELQQEALNINDFETRRGAIGDALKCEALPRLKSMVELCQSEEGVCIDANGFDNNKMLLNVQNGTIDLITGKLLPHNPLDYITKISPVKYDPAAKCDRFMQFLNEALFYNNDEEMDLNTRQQHTQNIIEYLKRFSGYCMTGNTKEEQFLILLGDGGHGKSKYVGAIGYVLGDYYNKIDIATIQESAKGKDGSTPTPDIVKMKGLRLISTSEPDKGLRLNESRIKDFSGRDPITCRDLHASPITYFPEYKLCIYTNYQIIVRGQDKSIWRRIHQVKFDSEPREIDKDLDLKFQVEGAGILNWMIQGVLEWNKSGLSTPSEIINNVAEYKDDMDILSGFFNLCCICDKSDKTLKESAKDLFYAYQSWWELENNSRAPYFDRQFYQNLEERGYKRVEKYSRTGLLIKGVKLCEEVKESIVKAKTIYGAFDCEAVKLVKDFLGIFVPAPHMEKKPDNSLTTLTPSQDMSINSVLPSQLKNIGVNSPSQENKPLNELTQLLFKASKEYQKPINSGNINNFCLWVCEHYHPQWQTGTETGYYQPSGIKGIASKIFGLMPEPTGGK